MVSIERVDVDTTMRQPNSMLAVLILTTLTVSSIAVKELDFIDKDETKLVLVLASQRAGRVFQAVHTYTQSTPFA